MHPRLIYEGSIKVDDLDYAHYVERDGDYVRVEIDGLDDIVTRAPRLRFTLDYPFEKPCEGTVVGDAGVTLRQIIAAIRTCFRAMYRGAVHEPIPNLHNQRVDGDYGRAFHAIGDLV